MKVITVVALVLILATSAYGLEKKAYQMRDDFGTQPLYDCTMQYFYYIPCTTTGGSYFWAYTGWAFNDIIGQFFTVGDVSMDVPTTCAPAPSCDPCNAHTIEQLRILDFAGYGTSYPGVETVEMSIYCADAMGCPVGAPLWTSDPIEFCFGWNYVPIPNVCVTTCHTTTAPYCYPRFLITAKMIGSTPAYPAWALDNISSPLGLACLMHDRGCCPVLYPRPMNSYYSTIHSGYYGQDFQYCPPQWILDGGDTTDGTTFGFIEFAWKVYLVNSGPTATEPSTWGNIKSMYR